MTLDLLHDRGVPLERQRFTWTELAQPPLSKLDADALTRIRVLLATSMEADANRFGHAIAQLYSHLQAPLAVIRRVEHHQQTLVYGLMSPDLAPLETSVAYEQASVEIVAAIAKRERLPYAAAIYRFGMLDDLDHLYRFAALLDRLHGVDANTILQAYTDVVPGRPTALEHRHPLDDLRRPYEAARAPLASKLHARTAAALAHLARDHYVAIGPMFVDPVARQLHAEIASIEEQHVTQYATLIDPRESALEKLLLHEAAEAYAYWSCVESEHDPHARAIFERMLDYELGHVQAVAAMIESIERRDPAAILSAALDEPIELAGSRDFVRDVLAREVMLGARGHELVPREREHERTRLYRACLERDDVPSNVAAAGWSWCPGTELLSGEPRVTDQPAQEPS